MSSDSEDEESLGLSPRRKEEFKAAFELLDKNEDGKITLDDIIYIMKNIDLSPTLTEIQEMINEVDLDGNSIIDFEEFVTLLMKKMQDDDTEEELLEAFKMFDRDGNGNITQDEIKATLNEIGTTLNDEELDILYEKVGKSKNDEINYVDFVKMLKQNDN